MKPETESDQDDGRGKLRRDINFLIISGITLVATMGVTSISPAFPKIVQELNISPQAVGLLITVFTLPAFVSIPVVGILADRLGRRRVIAPLLILFGIAGGGCILVRDFNLLLILRFLQGIGAASLVPLCIVMMCDLYSGRKRTAALYINSGILSAGIAIFPGIGGALATMGWHYPFLIFLAAIPLGFLTLFSMKIPEQKSGQRLREYLGNIWQVMKNPQAFGLFVVYTFTGIILFGPYLTYFPLLMSNKFDSSSLVIGLIISGTFLIAALTSSQLGKLKTSNWEGNLIKVSFILYALALVIIPLVSEIWLLLIPAIIFGTSHGISIPARHTLAGRLAPINNRAAFMAVAEIFFLFGQTSGPLLTGTIFDTWGMSGAFYGIAALSIVAFAFATIIRKVQT